MTVGVGRLEFGQATTLGYEVVSVNRGLTRPRHDAPEYATHTNDPLIAEFSAIPGDEAGRAVSAPAMAPHGHAQAGKTPRAAPAGSRRTTSE